MASHRRILNQSTKMYTDYDTAVQMVEDWCACGWVDKDTIRSLSGEESRLARIQQAAVREPLAYAEIPGLKFEGPIPTDYSLIRAAHELCAQ